MTGSIDQLASGVRVRHCNETNSTNEDALRSAQSGEIGPLWIIAERQTAGRGRAGRAWASSDSGNFYGTYLTTVTCPSATAAQLALVAGVSLFEAILEVAPRLGAPSVDQKSSQSARLKWPNDLLLGSAKVGGILIETSARTGGKALSTAIGFGVNLTHAPEGLDRSVAKLCDDGTNVGVPQLLDALSSSLKHWLAVWDEGRGFSLVCRRWMERAGPLGEQVRVNTADGEMIGRYQGLDEHGALVVVDDTGAVRQIAFGDVDILDQTQ